MGSFDGSFSKRRDCSAPAWPWELTLAREHRATPALAGRTRNIPRRTTPTRGPATFPFALLGVRESRCRHWASVDTILETSKISKRQFGWFTRPSIRGLLFSITAGNITTGRAKIGWAEP